MKDYWAYLSVIIGNVAESFSDHSAIYVISAYDFRLEISFGILQNTDKSNVW